MAKYTVTLADKSKVLVEATAVEVSDAFVVLYDVVATKATPAETKAVFRSSKVIHVLREDYADVTVRRRLSRPGRLRQSRGDTDGSIRVERHFPKTAPPASGVPSAVPSEVSTTAKSNGSRAKAAPPALGEATPAS